MSAKLLPVLPTLVVSIVLSVSTHADERITVGDKTVIVPPPAGFVRLDGRSAAIDAMLKNFVAADNTNLAAFVTAADANALKRYFLLQIQTKAIDRKMTLANFKDAKEQIVKLIENSSSTDKIKTETNDALKKAGASDFQIGSTTSLGVIEEGEEFIETGLIMRTSPKDPPMVSISNALVVNGKYIYGYAYSSYTSAADIEWTKSAAKAWRQSILAANPGGTEKGGFLSTRTGQSAVIGGVIGAIGAHFFRKKKQT